MKRGVDYIGVGAGAIISNGKDQYLLCRRGKKAKNERGKWEFPGGAVEFGNTLRETIIREMKEELDIEVEPLEQLTAINHILPHENQHWVTTGFICKIRKGKPKIMEPHKCSEIGWFTISEISKMELTLPTKIYLGVLIKRNI